MGFRTIIGVAATLLLPLSLVAQDPGWVRGGGFTAARLLLDQGSAEFLAGKAAELTLTDQQKVQLTELATKFKDATKSERERLAAILPAGGPRGGRGGGGGVFQEARALLARVQKEDNATKEEALELLNDEQRATAVKLLAYRRPRLPGG